MSLQTVLDPDKYRGSLHSRECPGLYTILCFKTYKSHVIDMHICQDNAILTVYYKCSCNAVQTSIKVNVI